MMHEDLEKPAEPASLYQLLGEAPGVRALVNRFYDLMDAQSAPSAQSEFGVLRALHPPSLDNAREKLFLFLTGWSGGPDLYVQRFGHPRLRARHLPFRITSVERDQWVRCMAYAMQDNGIDDAVRERLLQSFFDLADFMRNAPD